MRIGRINGPTGQHFVFGTADRPGWVSAFAAGLAVHTLADVVEQLPALRATAAAIEPDVEQEVDLLAPIEHPGKILAVGLNYLRHIQEVEKPQPATPMIFAKYPSSLTGPYGVIELAPDITSEVDYECELAVVIGRKARSVSESDAFNHVLGYCVANDVSARDVQRSESQLSRSKGLDTFCPLGPWITTADKVPDPHALRIRTTVNADSRQDSSTDDMLFRVPYLVSYLSRTMTLHPGDVLLTGTPPGVGSGMKPPSYLGHGDVVRCEVEGLGALENRVCSPELR